MMMMACHLLPILIRECSYFKISEANISEFPEYLETSRKSWTHSSYQNKFHEDNKD